MTQILCRFSPGRIAAPMVAGFCTLTAMLGNMPGFAKEIAAFPGVTVVQNLDFLGPDRAERCDLYMPNETSAAPRPAVLIVHGGGWTGGDKGREREQNIGNTLASHGYVCISINYLLATESPNFTDRFKVAFPQNLHDCKTAVRYLRENAQKYNIDPTRIGAIGGSAGGHLVAMLAVTDDADGLDPTGPYGEHSCRIQAVVPLYGVHDLTLLGSGSLSDADRALLVKSSPVTYVTSDDPPMLILHGTADALVPVRQSEVLHEANEHAGVSSTIHIVKDAPHTFDLQPAQEDLRPLVLEFFDAHLKRGSLER